MNDEDRTALMSWANEHWHGDCACYEQPCEFVETAELVALLDSGNTRLEKMLAFCMEKWRGGCTSCLAKASMSTPRLSATLGGLSTKDGTHCHERP